MEHSNLHRSDNMYGEIGNKEGFSGLSKGWRGVVLAFKENGDAKLGFPFSHFLTGVEEDWLLKSNFHMVDRISEDVMRDEMHDVLRTAPRYGMFNIFVTHPGPMRMLPLFILFAQFVLPCALVMHMYSKLESGWCPGTADRCMQVVMSAVLLVYFCRSSMMCFVKYAETYIPGVDKAILSPSLRAQQEKVIHTMICCSVLSDCGTVDEFMHTMYESVVTLINLWFLCIASDAFDVVFNSLAMEFIPRLDAEFKSFYMDIFGYSVSNILKLKLNIQLIDDSLWIGDKPLDTIPGASSQFHHDFLWSFVQRLTWVPVQGLSM